MTLARTGPKPTLALVELFTSTKTIRQVETGFPTLATIKALEGQNGGLLHVPASRTPSFGEEQEIGERQVDHGELRQLGVLVR